jgi:hypothetical protein
VPDYGSTDYRIHDQRGGDAQMKPLYPELRKDMKQYGIDDEYLSEQLGISERSLRDRFRNIKGRTWRLEEQYKVLRIIGQPPEKIYHYFPYYPTKEASRP